MPYTFRPLHEGFAAEFVGLDLREPPSRAAIDEIEQVLLACPVLCLRAQHVDDAQHQRFMKMFGPVHVSNLAELGTNNDLVFDVGTADAEGKPIPKGSVRALYLLANQLWHTDGSQLEIPFRLTALSARVLPPVPPDTEYADMRAAWDALPGARQRELEGLMIEHSIFASRAKMGLAMSDFANESRKDRPAVVHPLVRTHRRSGRKSLYLASHASHVVGWPIDEGRALLDELIAFATQPQFVYAHRWQEADLVMWDDSCTMHRATPYDEPHPRIMRSCGVKETAPV